MMTEEVRLFFEMIRDFLSIFLPKQRGASKNTVKSYREALNLLLNFLCEKMKKPLASLSFADTSKDNVLEYLDWLEAKRNNSVSSRNQRLFAIKSFFKYVAERDSQVLMEQVRLKEPLFFYISENDAEFVLLSQLSALQAWI